MFARALFKIEHMVYIMLILHAKNQHPKSNHQGEMNQKPKKGIFTLVTLAWLLALVSVQYDILTF